MRGSRLPKWEYASFFWGGSSELTIRTMEFSHPNFKTNKQVDADGFWDAMRHLGEEGWELVSVSDPPDSSWQRFFFKRPLE